MSLLIYCAVFTSWEGTNRNLWHVYVPHTSASSLLSRTHCGWRQVIHIQHLIKGADSLQPGHTPSECCCSSHLSLFCLLTADTPGGGSVYQFVRGGCCFGRIGFTKVAKVAPQLVDRGLLPVVKTHHYIIFFVRPLHSKPGMESYCWLSTDQLS